MEELILVMLQLIIYMEQLFSLWNQTKSSFEAVGRLVESDLRPSGEIGKHSGLKIHRLWLAGSIPALGTTQTGPLAQLVRADDS